MGPWPEDRRLSTIGLFQREQFLGAIHGIALGTKAKVSQIPIAEIQVELAAVRKEVRDPTIHGYYRA